MREVIQLQIGQCGNAIGAGFWESISKEHGLDSNGSKEESSVTEIERMNVYFREMAPNIFSPRAILVDIEPGVVDNILTGPIGPLIRRENIALGMGRGNPWMQGFGFDNSDLVGDVLNTVRREAEACDCFQGFQITHSIGGSTGSGLGSTIMTAIRDEYPDRMMATFSVLPPKGLSHAATEAYNVALAVDRLMEVSDATVCIDDQALYDLCTGSLGISNPSYRDLNRLISSAMAGVTAHFRYPNQVHSDFQKFVAALVPNPRLKLLVPAHIPLAGEASSATVSSPDLIQQLFDDQNMMVSSEFVNEYRYISSAIFRGPFSVRQVEDDIRSQHDNSASLVSKALYRSFCSVSGHGSRQSITVINNSTAIKDPLIRFNDIADALLRRKAWLHWYEDQGMDSGEIAEAHLNMNDLISEYQARENSTGA